MPEPRVLSLGAGVQSTTLLLLSAEGRIPRYDVAIFADTGWEPSAVYAHLDRIEREIARPAGIPIQRVRVGNIRDDALDPAHRFASMPLFVRKRDGTRGMARRQCSAEYKIRPIREALRTLLGAKPKANGRPGPPPRGRTAVQSIGISRDEVIRAKDSGVSYSRHEFPLLDLDGAADGRPGWTRADCVRYLRRNGFGQTPRSACVGCPFRRNDSWRALRDTDPHTWADAVEFDRAIRHGSARANAAGHPLDGKFYLHPSCVPLDEAPIDRVTRGEWADRQTNLFDAIADTEAGLTDEIGCSPFTCRADLFEELP
ncbi:hypothetical protein GCM10012275_39720 [Longimycelium tulufanense]|uniref:Phosphoadenosine phosphosulfate reductase n=1 Tax=Longimycelium tulufanense TaxID=907463 RepID=A0A8J3FVP9_9PSEU|nr:hypothetical protein [Longimycelium tulufanense]GGM65219.1 hypothetical protein GCM10012275_39720 [Longimycelium tulufanense]